LSTCDVVVATLMLNCRAISLSLGPLLINSAVCRSRSVRTGAGNPALRLSPRAAAERCSTKQSGREGLVQPQL
jgi:hypothetical protein